MFYNITMYLKNEYNRYTFVFIIFEQKSVKKKHKFRDCRKNTFQCLTTEKQIASILKI